MTVKVPSAATSAVPTTLPLAISTAVSPGWPPEPLKAGRDSLVRSSVLETPLSLASVMSGAMVGASGAALSTVTTSWVALLVRPPATATALTCVSPSANGCVVCTLHAPFASATASSVSPGSVTRTVAPAGAVPVSSGRSTDVMLSVFEPVLLLSSNAIVGAATGEESPPPPPPPPPPAPAAAAAPSAIAAIAPGDIAAAAGAAAAAGVLAAAAPRSVSPSRPSDCPSALASVPTPDSISLTLTKLAASADHA